MVLDCNMTLITGQKGLQKKLRSDGDVIICFWMAFARGEASDRTGHQRTTSTLVSCLLRRTAVQIRIHIRE